MSKQWHGGKGDTPRKNSTDNDVFWQPNFDLSDLIGETLFANGPNGIACCRVMDKHKVKFKNAIISLKECTRRIFGTCEDYTGKWTYNHVILKELDK